MTTKNSHNTGASAAIRAYLQQHPDGATAQEVSAAIEAQGINPENARRLIYQMRDRGVVISAAPGPIDPHNRQPTPRYMLNPNHARQKNGKRPSGTARVDLEQAATIAHLRQELERSQAERNRLGHEIADLLNSPAPAIPAVTLEAIAAPPAPLLVHVNGYRFGLNHIIFVDETSKTRTTVTLDLQEIDARSNKRINRVFIFDGAESECLRRQLAAATIAPGADPTAADRVENLTQELAAAQALGEEAEQRAKNAEARAEIAERRQQQAEEKLAAITKALGQS